MYLTDVTLPTPPPAIWLISPQIRESVLRVVEAPHATRRRDVEKRYADLCEQAKLLENNFSLPSIKKGLPLPLIRSAIHALNCRLLRAISGIYPCVDDCCCDCIAGPKNLPCLGHFYAAIAHQKQSN